MKEETKMEISAALNTLIKNGVSIALAGSEDAGEDDGRILFFDTDEYYRTGKMDGVSVKTVDLVR